MNLITKPTVDLTGQVFKQLTVLGTSSLRDKYNRIQWVCACTCGSHTVSGNSHLVSGNTKSCGCRRILTSSVNGKKKTHGMTKTPEYKGWQTLKNQCYDENYHTYHLYGEVGIRMCNDWKSSFESYYRDMGPRPGPGYRVGRIDPNGNFEPGNCKWFSKEDQERDRINRTGVLVDGVMCNTTKTPEYSTWVNIRRRCYDPNCPPYMNYGGRGIKVCKEWNESFIQFYKDMGPRPGVGYSIEREDNDGDYEPGNCKWVTMLVQANNRRNNSKYIVNGEEKTISQLSREYNIPVATLVSRLGRMGLSIEEALGKSRDKAKFKLGDEQLTIQEWADKLDMSYAKVYWHCVTRNRPIASLT